MYMRRAYAQMTTTLPSLAASAVSISQSQSPWRRLCLARLGPVVVRPSSVPYSRVHLSDVFIAGLRVLPQACCQAQGAYIRNTSLFVLLPLRLPFIYPLSSPLTFIIPSSSSPTFVSPFFCSFTFHLSFFLFSSLNY